MVSIIQFREIALSLPEVVELPHFEKTSFRVNKKIFATLVEKDYKACLSLSEIDQDVFSRLGKQAIYPVPNKWGKHGWTIVDLNEVGERIFKDVLATAYCKVAPQRLAVKINRDGQH